ncbi:MAG: hypothetical protein WD628_06380 [Thermomicrobiales bacterium]
MPRHVVSMIAVVGAFFVLLWFGVVVLGLTGGKATLASIATLFLLGLGVTFSATTSRGDE